MKIEIELTEEAAACLWDDVTHGGQHPQTIAEIAQTYVTGRAALAVVQMQEAYRPAIVAKFKAAGQPAPPEPTQSKPDCDCGSKNASWHGEAPDLREYCCPTCYWRRTTAAQTNLPRTT